MNCFSQHENGLFATQKDLDELAHKEKAKILVISDTHGATDILSLILEEFAPKADALIFNGDGIYDLIEEMEKCYHYKRPLPPVIGFVKGNNDPSTATASFAEHINVPSKIIVKAGSKNILVTHGHNESVYYDFSALQQTAQLYEANAVLFGHTHVPAELMSNPYLMNPGSVGYPRNGGKPSFAMLEVIGPNIVSVFYRLETSEGLNFVPFIPEPFYGY